MKHWLTASLVAIALASACGGKTMVDEVTVEAGFASSFEGGARCGSCQSIEDCQKTCEPLEGTGTVCCDLPSATCFITRSNSCPAADDAGTD